MKHTLHIAVFLLLVWNHLPAEQDGFRYPAEWEPHESIWMGLRTHETEALRATGHRHHHDLLTVPMLKALTPHVQVNVVVEGEQLKRDVLGLLVRSGVDTSRITVHIQRPTHIWYRDIGPIFLTNGDGLAIADFAFSDYANVRPEQFTSKAIALGRTDSNLANHLSIPTIESPLVMEGGSLTVNGKGTVIVSELTRRRNPHLTRPEIETELARVLGQQKVIWLKEGPIEDQGDWKKIADSYWAAGTGGHTDEFVSFLDPQTVALSWVIEAEKDANPVNRINYARMADNLRILEAAVDQDGQPFRVVKLPVPDLQYEEVVLPPSNIPAFQPADPTIRAGDTIRWVAVSSYMNYLITNGIVLLPKFWSPGMAESQKSKDERVLEIFKTTYPHREIVQISPLILNHLGGGMHCLIQTQPLVR